MELLRFPLCASCAFLWPPCCRSSRRVLTPRRSLGTWILGLGTSPFPPCASCAFWWLTHLALRNHQPSSIPHLPLSASCASLRQNPGKEYPRNARTLTKSDSREFAVEIPWSFGLGHWPFSHLTSGLRPLPTSLRPLSSSVQFPLPFRVNSCLSWVSVLPSQ